VSGPRRATPVLRVGDYPRSLAYWRDVLGFSVDEEGGDPPRFAIVSRGAAVVFLDAWHGPPVPRAAGWDVYFHVDDADLLHETYAAAGAYVVREPQTTVYGMREFELMDPDGNRLCFGTDAPMPA